MTAPPVSYYLLAAAGVEKGASKPGWCAVLSAAACLASPPPSGHDMAGQVSLKHVFEIAKAKSADPAFAGVPLESVCKTVVGAARSMGIRVVRT